MYGRISANILKTLLSGNHVVRAMRRPLRGLTPIRAAAYARKSSTSVVASRHGVSVDPPLVANFAERPATYVAPVAVVFRWEEAAMRARASRSSPRTPLGVFQIKQSGPDSEVARGQSAGRYPAVCKPGEVLNRFARLK